MKNEFIIETYFDIPTNAINHETRDKVSQVEINLIKNILDTEFSDFGYEICYLPSEYGSYKKKIIVVLKGAAYLFGGIGINVISDFVIKGVSYPPIYERVDAVEKYQDFCTNGLDMVKDTKVIDFCKSSYKIEEDAKKYKVLKKDKEVSKIISSLVVNGKVIKEKEKEITRDMFDDYIFELDSINDSCTVKGVIEVTIPVFKQSSNGKTQWHGMYYGDDIELNGKIIKRNESGIDFYMSDKDFVKKVENKEKLFGAGDCIKVVMDVVDKGLDGKTSDSYHIKLVVDDNVSLEDTYNMYKKEALLDEIAAKKEAIANEIAAKEKEYDESDYKGSMFEYADKNPEVIKIDLSNKLK